MTQALHYVAWVYISVPLNEWLHRQDWEQKLICTRNIDILEKKEKINETRTLLTWCL